MTELTESTPPASPDPSISAQPSTSGVPRGAQWRIALLSLTLALFLCVCSAFASSWFSGTIDIITAVAASGTAAGAVVLAFIPSIKSDSARELVNTYTLGLIAGCAVYLAINLWVFVLR
ncbi:hypothetical protein [Microterricola viridarii]|uniref:hypothetical protein n=1 Tax=Microterricola viridarii TaxID=412690 RepID=UPI0012EAF7E1|nr:hypothetical protein [Microterricola viridarii]